MRAVPAIVPRATPGRLAEIILAALAVLLVAVAIDVHGLTGPGAAHAHLDDQLAAISAPPGDQLAPDRHQHIEPDSTHLHPGPASPAGAGGGSPSGAAVERRSATSAATPETARRASRDAAGGLPPPSSAQLQVLRN